MTRFRPNYLPKAHCRPAFPFGNQKPLGRAVHAVVGLVFGGRSATR
jgi:hypothetical protein